MRTLITVSLLLLTLSCNAGDAVGRTIKAQVNGMVCAFCAQGIEKKLRAMTQTEDVFVDLKNKLVAVQLKEGQALSSDTITDLIKDAGYDVSKIETVAVPVATIRADTQARK